MEANATKTYTFELMLTGDHSGRQLEASDFLDSVEQELFEAFQGDVTPATMSGVPVLYCTVEGESIEHAVLSVASRIVAMGLHPDQLVMKFGSGGLQLA